MLLLATVLACSITAALQPLPASFPTHSEWAPRFALGLPTADDLPAAAALLVDAFGAEGAVRDERLAQAAHGLRWRLGDRLAVPNVDASLEASVLLLVTEPATGALAAGAELCLKPADGTLPAEFALPALFTVHDDAAPLAPYLLNLCVTPAYRRQRLGSRLLRTCEQYVARAWERRALYLHVDVHNAGAMALYTRAGFTPLPGADALGTCAHTARTVLNRWYVKDVSLTVREKL